MARDGLTQRSEVKQEGGGMETLRRQVDRTTAQRQILRIRVRSTSPIIAKPHRPQRHAIELSTGAIRTNRTSATAHWPQYCRYG